MAITNFGNFGNRLKAVPLLNRNMEHQPEQRIVLPPKQLTRFVPCSGSLCDFHLTVINGSTAGLTGNRELQADFSMPPISLYSLFVVLRACAFKWLPRKHNSRHRRNQPEQIFPAIDAGCAGVTAVPPHFSGAQRIRESPAVNSSRVETNLPISITEDAEETI